jgi:diguanylate cyclase (GGDEF)-like protein
MDGKFKILVADDNADKRLLLTVALQDAGYEVMTVNDGAAALKMVDKFEPDLVVADVVMPKVDGYELARRIRSNPQTKFIPVVLQTTERSDDEDARRSAEVGALGYITDPTDLDLLLARVRTLLDFKAYLDACEEDAYTDYLTGLANRRRFERFLNREVTRCIRYERTFCLLWLDIDNFKQINDKYGHGAGDEAIKMVAHTLQKGIRGIDLAARVGGEEFGLILPETELEAGCEVAERLRRNLRKMKIPNDGRLTASFGVAAFPLHGKTGKSIVTAADAAMYEAKHLGRDRIQRAATKLNRAKAMSVTSQ